MAERDNERRPPRAVLLIGAGPCAREAGTVLAALSTLDPQGAARFEPLAQVGLADLDELLAQRPLEYLLILEAGRVPLEDIGMVRRFLERHPLRRLLVLGTEKQEARALLALGRAHWLAWPPNLAELRALLPAQEPASLGPSPATPESARNEREGQKLVRRGGPLAQGGVDLRGLLEELLAGAALAGGSTRFHLQSGEACLVLQERGTLLEALGGLVELARLCAGGDGLVRAALDKNGEAILLGLEFPRAGLPEKELPTLFERPPASLETPEAGGLGQARRSIELLRAIGGRVELSNAEPGRVRCDVRLLLPPRAPGKPARVGKPEDPFA